MASEEAKAVNETRKSIQIVGTFPEIVVTGTAENPYYQIKYLETEDGEIHIGYGSYELAYVFQWLAEFFGVAHATAVDPESLRPKGRWGVQRESEISKTVYCTNCWKEFYIHRKGEVQIDTQPYCPNCGAKMEG